MGVVTYQFETHKTWEAFYWLILQHIYTWVFWLVGVVNPDLRQNAGDFPAGQQKVKSWSTLISYIMAQK